MARKTGSRKKSTQKDIAGRYRVLRSLGQGGGGAVYLVNDLSAGERPLALKMVAGAEGGSQAVTDLKNEFSTLSQLRHPNLAAVYDFDAAEEGMFFTSEWIDGRDILEAARHADLNTVFQLVVQILRALDFLHQRGVLHLDLKPANILVTDPDRTGSLSVKLIDFGIAQWKRHGSIQAPGFSGTPPYAAPEQIQEQEATPASDLYSLGMVLHQIFAGRFPFATQNPFEILMRQTYEDPQRAERIDPALPPDFADFLQRMVAREPASRFASAREALDDINRRLGEKFSLRGQRAPVRILEESDHVFQPEVLAQLTARIAEKGRVKLAGPPGSGKTRLLERLKAELQLQGLRPHFFRSRSSWENFSPGGDARPLLVDLNESPTAADEKILAAYAGPSVWAQREPSDSGLALPPLDEEKIGAFLGAEIRGTPEGFATKLAAQLKPPTPGKLGEILQALRDEGQLAWGQGGWNWEGEIPKDYAALTERQALREAKRKDEVREFLEASGLQLPAHVLEGMLGFEAGALADKLKQWEEEGWLRAEVQKGVTCYSVPSGGAAAAEKAAADPAQLADQLEALYEQGRFGAGIAWFEQVATQSGAAGVPPKVALAGARHYVAEGQAQRSLDLLKGLNFTADADQGLLFETRARAENLLARFDEAKVSLAQAETHYQAAVGVRGLARVYNLRGILFRNERRWPESEDNLQKAVANAVEAGDLYCAGLAQTNLALVYQDQGKGDAAYEGYQKAWDFARREPHPFLLQSLYQKWINLLHHGGRSAEAEAACYEWMKLAIRHRYSDQQAIALNYLSLIAGKKGHLELKISYLDQAIALLDGKKHPRFLAQFHVNRAYLHWTQGKYLPAQLDAEAALQLGKLWPDDRLWGWLYTILGKIYRDRPQPDYEASAEAFEKALANVQKNQNRESLWEVEYNRGLLAKARGDPVQAEAYLLAAKAAVEAFLAHLPEALRGSYLRDRKLETVLGELEALKKGPA